MGFRETLKNAIEQLLSKRIISILALVFIIFLTSGGIFTLIEAPGAAVSTSSGTSFLVKSTSSMTSSELIVAFVLTLAGAAGFILMAGAFKKSYDLSSLKIRYLIGFILIVLSIGLLEFLTYAKVH